MGTYIKKSLFAILYLFIMIVTSISITFMIDDDQVLLKLVLAIVNFFCYAVVVAVISFRDGEEAMRTRYSNDTLRERIIATGEDLPLKIHAEYKWWKGFVHALIVCFPLFLLLFMHTVILLIAGTSGTQVFGGLAETVYSVVFDFFEIFDVSEKIFGTQNFYAHYLVLAVVPVFLAVLGIPYICGAKKTEKQFLVIEQQRDVIYGDKK